MAKIIIWEKSVSFKDWFLSIKPQEPEWLREQNLWPKQKIISSLLI